MVLLQDIPGFKRILKTVLQLQIKQLVDQLAEQTGDECIVLVASIPDRTLCQLGTKHGEDFLRNKDELKTDFLHHCLQNSGDKSEDDSTSKKSGTKSRKRGISQKQSDLEGGEAEDSYTYGVEKEHSCRKKTKGARKVVTRDCYRKDKKLDDMIVVAREDSLSGTDTSDVVKDKTGEAHEPLENISTGKVTGREQIECESKEFDTNIGNPTRNKSRRDNVDNDVGMNQKGIEGEYLIESEQEHGGAVGEDVLKKEVDGDTASTDHVKEEQRFISGKPLSEDLRTSLILQIIENGGDVKTGHVPRGVYTKVQKMFGVPAASSVTRIWERYVSDGTIATRKGQ